MFDNGEIALIYKYVKTGASRKQGREVRMTNHPNRRRDPRIDEVRHEGSGEWFVYLVPGWCLDPGPNPQHCFGEDTRSAVRETMKRIVPCECVECQAMTISNSAGELLAELNRSR